MPDEDPLSKTWIREAVRDGVKKEVAPIKTLLSGPTGDPQKGYIVRMDRVERICKMLVWAMGMIFSGFILAGIHNLVGLVFKNT